MTIKKPVKKTRVRTRSRVERVEGDSREEDGYKISGKSAKHRSSDAEGMVNILDENSVLISSQFSEVVPVGRFAGITIGPVMLSWKLGNVDIQLLADIDWESDAELTAAQQEVYDRVLNSIRSSGKLIQHIIDEDREIIDKAVERYNARELEEEKEKKSTPSKRR